MNITREKLKRIIKEEIEALSEQTAGPVDLFTNYIEFDDDLGTDFEEFERSMEQKPYVKDLVGLAIRMNPRMQKLSPEQQKDFNTVIGLIKKYLKYEVV